MSWLSRFFVSNKNVGRFLLELARKMLVVFVGRLAQDLQSIAIEEVLRAEASGLDGQAKWKMAYEGIKSRLKTEVKEHVINLAIETALSAILANRK